MKNRLLAAFCAVVLVGGLSGRALAQPSVTTLPDDEFRSVDGSGNNLAHPEWGATFTHLLRTAPAAYDDGVSAPSGADRPDARLVSDLVVSQPPISLGRRGPTNYLWIWGQFIDHDVDLTGTQGLANGGCAESFDIPVPAGDPFFDPASTGTQTIALCRSTFDPATGTGPGDPREQENIITAFIDASNVYGSDPVRAMTLRALDGTGRLKVTHSPVGDLLPFNTFGLPNASNPGMDPASLFLAGDVRSNENVVLTAIHTLWMREHNLWADRIRHRLRHASDEQIYQLAREVVGAEIQAITYNEFLPLLLGHHALPPFTGYHANVDPTVDSIFSTAAYRVGHTMLTSELQRIGWHGGPIQQGNLTLKDAFFNPEALISGGGIAPLLRGGARERCNDIDPYIVDDVRNFLFGPPGAGGFDLASLNIQRGRDHGEPGYNDVRIAFGLAPKPDIASINSDPEIQQRLAAAYTNVNDIDPWVGGLAEAPVDGGLVGELFATVIGDQFTRLRDGDRFYYENHFPPPWRAYFNHLRLADVLRRDAGIGHEIQNQAFRLP